MTVCLAPIIGVLLAFGQASSSVLLVHSHLDDRWKGEVWLVDATGAARVVLEFSPETVGQGGLEDSVVGSTLPHPAPNGRMIAYIQADDLWIFDVDMDQSRRITEVNADCREGDLIAQARLTAWSPDGSQLLFQIGKPIGPDPFAEYQRCRAAYGFYRFEAATGRSEPVGFLNADERNSNIQYGAFFGDERFLMVRREEGGGDAAGKREILVVDQDESNVVDAIQGWIEWVDLSADGKHASCWYLESEADTRAQILKLDLQTGASKVVSSNTDRLLGRSKLSPSGRRTAYEKHAFIDATPAEHEVMIDGQAVLDGALLDFEWFDDDRIAVLLRQEIDDSVVDAIVVVNAGTGQTVSRMEVSSY